jgi:YHS domain-containing protein
MPTRRTMMGSMLGATLAAGVARPSMAAPGVVSENGLALGGYDCVAYWTAQKAAKGQPSVSTKWNGVTWFFVNQENRAAFAANPERYSPAFNGYCAY